MSDKPLGTCDLMDEPHTKAFHCTNWKPEVAPPQPSAPPTPAEWNVARKHAVELAQKASAASAEPTGQEREEAERAELEREWLTQSQWLDYGNWLQAELLKARAALRASGKEGA